MKKGQIEIIGLLVVVVLIVVGALLYVKFALLTTDDNSYQRMHSLSIDSNNLISGLLNIKVCDGNYKISEAVLACSVNEPVCDQNACEFLKEEIISIFSVLEVENYSFYVLEGEEVFLSIGDCEYGVVTGSYALGGQFRDFIVQLKLCDVLSSEGEYIL